MPQDVRCLFSVVKNVSGKEMVFGFLPPHGRRLANNEEFSVFGDIKTAIVRHDRGESRRSILAFESALQDGLMEIIQTPAPILKDLDSGASKMLTLDDGDLGVDDPCWNTSVASATDMGSS